ncbi:MAG TPA: hypothetical protein VGQ42_03945 [Candidatus Dormibacteraeota bacterium]|jgi:hypothetical protein|nr:hypothetical protein [Candidatus Dormibacteraeota bacterium]
MRASPPRRATSDASQPTWVSDWWLPDTSVDVSRRVDVVGRREGGPAQATEMAVAGREVAIRGTREVAVRPN